MSREPIAEVAHRLRTPIAVVQGFADLLKRDDGRLTPEQRSEYAQRIIGAAGEMREILDATTAPSNGSVSEPADEPAPAA